jgi:hypothetical protein
MFSISIELDGEIFSVANSPLKNLALFGSVNLIRYSWLAEKMVYRCFGAKIAYFNNDNFFYPTQLAGYQAQQNYGGLNQWLPATGQNTAGQQNINVQPATQTIYFDSWWLGKKEK